jgi:glutamate-1-semialdehyde aminotransferase
MAHISTVRNKFTKILGHYPGEADSFMYHPKKEGKAIESSSEGQISFMDEEL